jgi:NAD+ kinase
LKVAIYSRVLDSTQQKDVQLFFDELDNEQIIPVVYEPYLKTISPFISLPSSTQTFSSTEDLTEEIDFFISLGGDGTLLDTVTLVRNKRIPIVGINFGRLGFLAGIGRDEMATAIKALARRSYIIDRRTLVHLDSNIPLFKDVPYALNEFAIHKISMANY